MIAERGLAPSRSAAATSIRAGLVRIGRGGERASKPGQLVGEDVPIEVEAKRRFVSRGGLKLEGALDRLGVGVEGRDCLDVGASNGGFTDCLLQRGAARVTALDVGSGQLDWALRSDERVTVLEGLNVRKLSAADLPYRPDLVTIDVSFISLARVLPALVPVLGEDASAVALVKPQFELGPGRVGGGGIVRDPDDRGEAVLGVARVAERLGLGVSGVAAAGLPGAKGNREVFLLLGAAPSRADLEQLIEQETR